MDWTQCTIGAEWWTGLNAPLVHRSLFLWYSVSTDVPAKWWTGLNAPLVHRSLFLWYSVSTDVPAKWWTGLNAPLVLSDGLDSMHHWCTEASFSDTVLAQMSLPSDGLDSMHHWCWVMDWTQCTIGAEWWTGLNAPLVLSDGLDSMHRWCWVMDWTQCTIGAEWWTGLNAPLVLSDGLDSMHHWCWVMDWTQCTVGAEWWTGLNAPLVLSDGLDSMHRWCTNALSHFYFSFECKSSESSQDEPKALHNGSCSIILCFRTDPLHSRGLQLRMSDCRFTQPVLNSHQISVEFISLFGLKTTCILCEEMLTVEHFSFLLWFYWSRRAVFHSLVTDDDVWGHVFGSNYLKEVDIYGNI